MFADELGNWDNAENKEIEMWLPKNQRKILAILAKSTKELSCSDLAKSMKLCKELRQCQYCDNACNIKFCNPIKFVFSDLVILNDKELIHLTVTRKRIASIFYISPKGKDLAEKYSNWFTWLGLWGKEHWNNPVVVILIGLASIIITAIITAYSTGLFTK